VLGVSMGELQSLCIKYKFTFDGEIKFTSYNYQKIFRSIYGYQQNVTKKSRKVYVYIRPGVLSRIPHIRCGRGSVILPLCCENELINYFNTGNNPTHNWKLKHFWKINYKIDTISIDKNSAITAILDLVNKKTIVSDNKFQSVFEVLESLASNINVDTLKRENINITLAKNIINTNWFQEVYINSEELNSFYRNYQKIIGFVS